MGEVPLNKLWKKKSENFFYDHRNLLDKYYFNSQFSSGSVNHEDNACFVIDLNAYQNHTEWQYVYNSSMAREQNRMYYTPSGLLSDPATDASGVYPWQYSLLDASNKETIIYQGFVNKDVMIKV